MENRMSDNRDSVTPCSMRTGSFQNLNFKLFPNNPSHSRSPLIESKKHKLYHDIDNSFCIKSSKRIKVGNLKNKCNVDPGISYDKQIIDVNPVEVSKDFVVLNETEISDDSNSSIINRSNKKSLEEWEIDDISSGCEVSPLKTSKIDPILLKKLASPILSSFTSPAPTKVSPSVDISTPVTCKSFKKQNITSHQDFSRADEEKAKLELRIHSAKSSAKIELPIKIESKKERCLIPCNNRLNFDSIHSDFSPDKLKEITLISDISPNKINIKSIDSALNIRKSSKKQTNKTIISEKCLGSLPNNCRNGNDCDLNIEIDYNSDTNSSNEETSFRYQIREALTPVKKLDRCLYNKQLINDKSPVGNHFQNVKNELDYLSSIVDNKVEDEVSPLNKSDDVLCVQLINDETPDKDFDTYNSCKASTKENVVRNLLDNFYEKNENLITVPVKQPEKLIINYESPEKKLGLRKISVCRSEPIQNVLNRYNSENDECYRNNINISYDNKNIKIIDFDAIFELENNAKLENIYESGKEISEGSEYSINDSTPIKSIEESSSKISMCADDTVNYNLYNFKHNSFAIIDQVDETPQSTQSDHNCILDYVCKFNITPDVSPEKDYAKFNTVTDSTKCNKLKLSVLKNENLLKLKLLAVEEELDSSTENANHLCSDKYTRYEIDTFPSPSKDAGITPFEYECVVQADIAGLTPQKVKNTPDTDDVIFIYKRKKRLLKSSSLLGKAVAAVNNLKSSQKLFQYELQVGLRNAEDYSISTPMEVIEMWSDRTSFYILCRKHSDSENCRNKVILILKQKPNHVTRNNLLKLYYPLTIFQSKNTDIIICLPFYVETIKNKITSNKTEYTSHNIRSNDLFYNRKTDNYHTILQNSKSQCIRETFLNSFFKMSVSITVKVVHKILSRTKIFFALIDDENQCCFMEITCKDTAKIIETIDSDCFQCILNNIKFTNNIYSFDNIQFKSLYQYCFDEDKCNKNSVIYTVVPNLDWTIKDLIVINKFKSVIKLSKIEDVNFNLVKRYKIMVKILRINANSLLVKAIDCDNEYRLVLDGCLFNYLFQLYVDLLFDGIICFKNNLIVDMFTSVSVL